MFMCICSDIDNMWYLFIYLFIYGCKPIEIHADNSQTGLYCSIFVHGLTAGCNDEQAISSLQNM